MVRLLFSGFALATSVCLSGCGPGMIAVSGIVKLDGQPVEGATVSFTSEDGTKSFSGYTDAGGNFTLAGPDKAGAMAGTYKVVVIKGKKVAGVENMNPDGADYKKLMEKMGKDQTKLKTGPAGPQAPGDGGKAVKSELPSKYASVTTTPITQKVPPDSQPVVIDLQSK